MCIRDRSSSLHPPSALRPSVYYPIINLAVSTRCDRTFCNYLNVLIYDPTCIALKSGGNSTARLKRFVVIPLFLSPYLPYFLPLDSLLLSRARLLHPDPSRHLSLYYRSSSLQCPSALTPSLFYPIIICLLYTSPSPRDATLSRMPSSA